MGGPRQRVYVQVVQTTNIIYILSCQNIDPLSEAFAPGMRVTEMNYCPCAVWLERPWREVTEIFRLASQIKRSLPEKKGYLKTVEEGVRVTAERIKKELEKVRIWAFS